VTIENQDQPLSEPAARPDYLGALRRSLPLLVFTILLAALVSFVISRDVLTPVYRSSATVIVKVAPGSASSDSAVNRLFTSDQSLGATFEELAKQSNVVGDAAARLGVPRATFTRHATAHSIPKTPLIQLFYSDSSPSKAEHGARAYTAAFLAEMTRAAWVPGQALPVSGATVPRGPSTPRTGLNVALAAIAGLAVGIMVVCVAAYSRATAPTPEPNATRRPRVRNGSNAASEPPARVGLRRGRT